MAADLEVLQVDVGQAADPQVQVLGREDGEQLQRYDGGQAAAHRCHPMLTGQLSETKVPNTSHVVLPVGKPITEERK